MCLRSDVERVQLNPVMGQSGKGVPEQTFDADRTEKSIRTRAQQGGEDSVPHGLPKEDSIYQSEVRRNQGSGVEPKDLHPTVYRGLCKG